MQELDGGWFRGVPFRGSLLGGRVRQGENGDQLKGRPPSLLGAVSARLALLGGSLGAMSAPSHRLVALLRPFGAFGVHFLSLFEVSFSRVRFCLDFGPKNGAKINDFGGCLMCAKCGK